MSEQEMALWQEAEEFVEAEWLDYSAARPPCLVCGKPCVPSLYEVVGFTKHREQGGANHIIDRRETGRVVGKCHDMEVKYGLPSVRERVKRVGDQLVKALLEEVTS